MVFLTGYYVVVVLQNFGGLEIYLNLGFDRKKVVVGFQR